MSGYSKWKHEFGINMIGLPGKHITRNNPYTLKWNYANYRVAVGLLVRQGNKNERVKR